MYDFRSYIYEKCWSDELLFLCFVMMMTASSQITYKFCENIHSLKRMIPELESYKSTFVQALRRCTLELDNFTITCQAVETQI